MKTAGRPDGHSGPNHTNGTLYLVGTPIGNLEDITLRALRVLREVDVIACEDTRQTQKLLNHYQIETPATSYHEHNEMTRAPELVLRLEEGARIALVSDAGMPGISDPGYRLVVLCIRHNITVTPVPGPSALVASLVASGLPTDSFQFFGFLPAKKTARRKFLEQLRESSSTSVLFESPHRIIESLEDILDVLGDRPTVLARELTKIHEEYVRGKCSAVLEELRKRSSVPGEITLLIAAAGEEQSHAVHSQPLKDRVGELMQQQSLTRMEALKAVARERRISKRQAYREFEASDE
ncbi:MAG: 16S rRNA (cytidine(1402)-2'-O)-methyltransferase [Acidobacteria bacterium]|nr:16S rRNA (cytidine(1402)-2'-O)-methyltransferase [Acidobacteriota bacterium]